MARAARAKDGAAAFSDFQVLLDDPAGAPAGGFDAYAQALADIILHSPPRFAVGIFGSWGSGKTTLMQAIGRKLDASPDVIQVTFNAWRYEREKHLIVPLLDTLREALAEWSRAHADTPDAAAVARRAAAAVGRAARALLLGLTLSAKVPFVAEASLDLGRVASGFEDQDADQPSSFYHTSFRSLERAIAEFVAQGRRIVVFIDDLDRCLPASALEVLESMKLFFDLPGFVFVVGLDQAVIERSIEFKYAQPGQRVVLWSARQTDENGESDGSLPSASPVSGNDYIKKIFQVPFSLPPIARADLRRFFTDIVDRANLPTRQRDDLRRTVFQHLAFLSADDTVNPREVKRFVNAYTLQLKMLAPKLGPKLEAHVVLALLVVGFRADWERVYGLLVADPATFVEAVRQADADGAAWIDDEPIPPSLLAYLAGPGAPLLNAALDPYVTSVEATQTSDRSLQTAQAHLSRLRRLVGEVRDRPPDAVRQSELQEHLGLLRGALTQTRKSPLVSNARVQIDALQLQIKELQEPSVDYGAWVDRARRRLDQLREILVALRREAAVGGRAQG